MDILTLYLAGRFIHYKFSKIRLIIASSLGGVAATVLTVFQDYIETWYALASIVLSLVISFLMSLIVFGYAGLLSLIRTSVIVWGSGALLGGIMTVIMSLGVPVHTSETTSGFVPIFTLCFGLCAIGVRLFTSVNSRTVADICITVNGKSYSFRGMCDSGSFATEPISGKPVIIVKSSVIAEISSRLDSPDNGYRIRLIPVGGMSGSTLLSGFVPDEVKLNGTPVDAVIAVDKSGGRFNGCDGIVPAALCKNK